MNTNDLKIFVELLIENLFRDYTKTLFLTDSSNSNKNEEVRNNLVRKYKDQIQLEKIIIPAGMTDKIQPYDVFFFRQWKQFTRHISDSFEVINKIWQRDNIFALQAFIHFQFMAPIFRDMIKYTFHKVGYYDKRPNHFKTPYNFLLPRSVNHVFASKLWLYGRCTVCSLFALPLFQPFVPRVFTY